MHAIGIDLGGTWIRTAIVTQDGILGSVSFCPTDATRDSEKILMSICEEIARVENQHGLSNRNLPIGIGIPTVLDEHGMLVSCPNLPTMGGIEIKKRLSSVLSRDVIIANDALCFTVGEWLWGCHKEYKHVIGLTLGTSIGLGFIMNGEVYIGRNGKAGELWHVPANIIGKDNHNVHDLLNGRVFGDQYYKRTNMSIDTLGVHKLAEQGDQIALEIFSEFGRNLGKVLFWLTSVLDPEIIFIGGSVANSFCFFERSMKEHLSDESVEICSSTLGVRAGVLGAASLALTKIQESNGERHDRILERK